MIRRLRRWRDQWRHPARYAQLAQLLAVNRLSADALRELQQQRFEGMVRHAVAQTGFYAEHYAACRLGDAGPISPQDLPLLRKSEMREHLDAMLARDVDRSIVKTGHTGGSTGTPLNFHYTDAKHELMLAGMKRGFMLSGWRPGDRVLYLWGAQRDVAGRGVFAHDAGAWLDSEHALAAVEYSESQLAAWLRLVERWRPTLLYGYASALTELARYIQSTGQPPPASLVAAYSTAETLDAEQRDIMQAAFGCKVFNQYGCREVPNIAWECRDGGMHVFSDLVYLESVPADDGNHRLLVTSLTDRVMPFIRYELGDSGQLLDTPCSCGLPYPLMQMSVCRDNDLVITPNGTRMHPSLLNRLLYGMTQIRSYQWVQLAPDRLRLNLVCDGQLSTAAHAQLVCGVQDSLSSMMSLDIEYLDQIPLTPAGKHRYVIGLEAASRYS